MTHFFDLPNEILAEIFYYSDVKLAVLRQVSREVRDLVDNDIQLWSHHLDLKDIKRAQEKNISYHQHIYQCYVALKDFIKTNRPHTKKSQVLRDLSSKGKESLTYAYLMVHHAPFKRFMLEGTSVHDILYMTDIGIAHESIALFLLKDPDNSWFKDSRPGENQFSSNCVGSLGAAHQSAASYIVENPTLLEKLELLDIVSILRHHEEVYLTFFKDKDCKKLFFSKLSSKRYLEDTGPRSWNRKVKNELLKMQRVIDNQRESSVWESKSVDELVDMIFQRLSDRQDLQANNSTTAPSP